MENENTADGILKVMQYMHKYVPGHDTDNLTQVISAGDLLSCERESNCQEEQQNSTSPSSRFEGLMPAIADFHAHANFLEVSIEPQTVDVLFYVFVLRKHNCCLTNKT